MASKNTNLHSAKKAKNDEFYTFMSDINAELNEYKDFFKGKVVYCNCDDARESNFFKYFSDAFEHLGIKKLITTGYNENGKGVVLIYEGDKNGNRMVEDSEIIVRELEGNGDFRSEECIEFLKEADVVVTNPPFSLFREYVAQLMEYGKKFLIIGPMNAVTYKEIFPYIKNNKLWLGENLKKGGTRKGNSLSFITPDGVTKDVSAWWFTNIECKRKNTLLETGCRYSIEDYPKYDNYDAIECAKSKLIPMDYNGVMGVPISFLMFHCPTQFEIIDAREVALNDKQKNKSTYLIKDADGAINGKPTYARICIRKKLSSAN